MFNRKEKKEVFQVKEEVQEPIGIVIHYTPVAVYLYICKDGFIEANDSGTLYFEDKEGNQIEISGTYVSVEIPSEVQIEDVVWKYGLKEIALPLIRIECQF